MDNLNEIKSQLNQKLQTIVKQGFECIGRERNGVLHISSSTKGEDHQQTTLGNTKLKLKKKGGGILNPKAALKQW